MVLHMAYAHPDGAGNTEAMSHVGFIVSRKVGNAVTRNRVKRRLRALVRDELARTPGGLRIVVRALPASATEPARLAEDLASAWASGLSKLGVRAGARQESGGGEAMKA
jgi:ribonuclease P protein component